MRNKMVRFLRVVIAIFLLALYITVYLVLLSYLAHACFGSQTVSFGAEYGIWLLLVFVFSVGMFFRGLFLAVPGMDGFYSNLDHLCVVCLRKFALSIPKPRPALNPRTKALAAAYAKSIKQTAVKPKAAAPKRGIASHAELNMIRDLDMSDMSGLNLGSIPLIDDCDDED